jgi:hypothetical protein
MPRGASPVKKLCIQTRIMLLQKVGQGIYIIFRTNKIKVAIKQKLLRITLFSTVIAFMATLTG